MKWWDQSLDIFNVEGRFRGDSILGEEFVQRGAEELAVDEEFQRNGLFRL